MTMGGLLASPPRYMSSLASGRDNNFNLLRMLAASAVLVSHAYPIALGMGALEPLSSLLGITLGWLSVFTFFAISGFFISKSFDVKGRLIEFWVARCLRIYPGLLGVLLLTVLLVGPNFTELSLQAYFSNGATWTYSFKNCTLKWLQYDLPGVFRDNPYPAAINGSLWTLFYEVMCYGMVAVVGVSGLARRTWCFVMFLGVYSAGYLAVKIVGVHQAGFVDYFHQLTLPFVIGMAFYQFRRLLPLNLILCCFGGSVTALAYGAPWFREVFLMFWSYMIFYCGSISCRLLRLYNKIGDYSYGVYIYAFPCEQICVAIWPGITPIGLMAVSFPVTLACAVLSWHILEQRALAYQIAVAKWLRPQSTFRR